MAEITPEMIAAGESILKPYLTDETISAAALAMQIYNCILDASPIRTKRSAVSKDEPEGFAAFYAAFPRREARRDAAKAYREAVTRAPALNILSGATRYTVATRGQDTKFIKLPATWLRADCWDDEVRTAFTVVQGGIVIEQCPTSSWVKRLEMFGGYFNGTPKGTWLSKWGPKPTETGCLAPEEARKMYRELHPKRA